MPTRGSADTGADELKDLVDFGAVLLARRISDLPNRTLRSVALVLAQSSVHAADLGEIDWSASTGVRVRSMLQSGDSDDSQSPG